MTRGQITVWTTNTTTQATFSISATLRPTVSLDARPVVIPILSCMLAFPVLVLALICALRFRAKRARRRFQHNRSRASGNDYFGSTRLKVLRDPPTFTELSVIAASARARSFSATEDDCSPIGCRRHSARHIHQVLTHDGCNGRAVMQVSMSLPASPLDILTGRSELGFSYSVEEAS